MRHFLVVSHTVDPSGQWALDDLAGGAGRVDVLARAVTMALFTSHGIRHDTDVTLVFVADPENPVAVRIRGAEVNQLNPDERSTAARIRNALRNAHPDPWWNSVDSGIEVAPFDIAEAIEDLDAPVVWLDRDGEDVMAEPLPKDCVWVLSDHTPFSEPEAQALAAHALYTVSLGATWYHGHHVIGIVQYLLDRQG